MKPPKPIVWVIRTRLDGRIQYVDARQTCPIWIFVATGGSFWVMRENTFLSELWSLSAAKRYARKAYVNGVGLTASKESA